MVQPLAHRSSSTKPADQGMLARFEVGIGKVVQQLGLSGQGKFDEVTAVAVIALCAGLVTVLLCSLVACLVCLICPPFLKGRKHVGQTSSQRLARPQRLQQLDADYSDDDE